MKSGFAERDGVLYIRCYRCGSYIANDKLGRHLSRECSQNSPRRKTIRQFCQKRDIQVVTHFTPIANLSSILGEGLLARTTLERRRRETGQSFVQVDPHRFDRRKDTISLSISFPNYLMFYKVRQETDDESWVVLSLRASLLWELECSFCRDNAASVPMQNRSFESLRRPDSLRDMFAERVVKDGVTIHRSELFIRDSYPTNPEAEVLVHEPIPADYISHVSFFSENQLDRWMQSYGSDGEGDPVSFTCSLNGPICSDHNACQIRQLVANTVSQS